MSEIKLTAASLDLDNLLEDIKEGRGVPSNWYVDNDIYELERKSIFLKSWQYVCAQERLKNPGDCVAESINDTPIVLTHGRDGEIRGFLNICRHRGHPLLDGDASKGVLACPYHAWTYNLDGTLRGVPECKSSDGIDKSELSLLPISVHVWAGAVFANLDAEAANFRDCYPELTELESLRGFDVTGEDYSFYKRTVYDVKANWKLWYDNHVECYHCAHIHGESFGEAYNTKADDEGYDIFEGKNLFSYSFGSGPSKDPNALRSDNYRSVEFFPGALIIQQEGIMIAAQITPTGPESTRYVFDCYAEKKADPERVERWYNVWHQTFGEDQQAVEKVNVGMRTGTLPRCHYLPSQELAALYTNKKTLEILTEKLK